MQGRGDFRQWQISVLQELLGQLETRLIDELLQGSSIAIAADKLGISENTARTQLRSVFSKTNVHRQAELIRLVLTSLAIIA